MNIYAAFVYSQGFDNFNALEIINNKDKLQEHLDCLVGFIYSTSKKSLESRGEYSKTLSDIFIELAKSVSITLTEFSFSRAKINEYAQSCIEKYEALPIHSERLEYLNGWTVTSQSRKTVLVNLDILYVRYGRNFSLKINGNLKAYALTQKTSTLNRKVLGFVSLLNSVAMLDTRGSVKSFEKLLSASHVHTTFYKAYQIQLTQCIAKGNDLYGFNRDFIDSIASYQSAFINTKTYPSPLKPLLKPDVKTVKNPPSFSTGGKPSDSEKLIWFSNIPLHIKDEEAIDIIEIRLSRVMGFMRQAFDRHFEKLKELQSRNEKLRNEGLVKPLLGNQGGSGERRRSFSIGGEDLANTIATFYHYGINGYTGGEYNAFLGFVGDTGALSKELNLPTNSTLLTLTTLLVMEHPKITPSWLQKLQLFDEYGKKCGYFQSGEQYILSSEKERRGRNLAQQDVILNEYSKSIIDFIIEHTQLAREHLKSIGNPDWKYLLLTCSLYRAVKPTSKHELYRRHQSRLRDLFSYSNQILDDDSLSSEEIELISSTSIHRVVRRHKGLQIYLETRSQSAVADALGHKEVQPQLLESYLPKPLMEFFTERVVRQFQKAIILKAMEGSLYLLDAVNMSYEEMEEFLENHGIADIPDLNAKAFENSTSDTELSLFDSIVFTVTVSLIQLLISIKKVIEGDSSKGELNFKDELVEHWYNCAVYLLGCFEQGDFKGNDDIEDMYTEAINNPLNPNVIKGAISC
ncbi:hypothetical protein DYL72_20310 [Vibrio anguillarum]|uniref:Uncharacterized protein n=1 Tax=Vibrio anguillarum TaxID=55601 RepID=A0A3M7LLL1_VIBAN|nr:hypothetical protein DYL72_20310 [Vibrio anguillarum]MBT2922030.1 hypothetical protein [Vibrio anguillarum]RMZ63089.1 hypothetical protein D9U34_15410 [Vibrio anguillarum]